MARRLYASVTNCSGIETISISESHDNSTTLGVVECRTTSLTLGDDITIDMGYTDDHAVLFTGYVKSIERKVPTNTYAITCSDIMVRAIDYFIAASNPESPLKYRNISAEDLIRNLMSQAGLTNFVCPHPTGFTFGVVNEFEVNLVPVYDYCHAIADNLTWHIWADEAGAVHLENRKPYVMINQAPENQQYGWAVDTSSGYTLTDVISIDQAYTKSEKNLRNRVVVYGESGIVGEASREVSVLPPGFYKSSVLGAPGLVDSNEIAQKIADYNLDLFCRYTEELRVNVLGDTTIRARTCIDSFNIALGITGLWYVDTCEHSLSKSGGYVTALGLRRMEKVE